MPPWAPGGGVCARVRWSWPARSRCTSCGTSSRGGIRTSTRTRTCRGSSRSRARCSGSRSPSSPRGWRSGSAGDDRPAYLPAGVRWLTASTLLTAIFALQEVTERLLAHGRVDVAESLVVHGGWVALPLCFVVGAVIALLLRGARALLTRDWGSSRPARARIAEPLPPPAPTRALRACPSSPATSRAARLLAS